VKQKADDSNNEFLIIRMGKVAKFKVLQEFLLGEPKKTTKSSVNLSGALRELRNHHFQNTGQKRSELCQVTRFLRILGDKLLQLRKSTLAWIYLTAIRGPESGIAVKVRVFIGCAWLQPVWCRQPNGRNRSSCTEIVANRNNPQYVY
jgi:hypothetical protein